MESPHTLSHLSLKRKFKYIIQTLKKDISEPLQLKNTKNCEKINNKSKMERNRFKVEWVFSMKGK